MHILFPAMLMNPKEEEENSSPGGFKITLQCRQGGGGHERRQSCLAMPPADAAPIVSICHGPNEEGRDRERKSASTLRGVSPKVDIVREVAWI